MDFNSLWPRRFGNILGTWELRSRIRGFIAIDGNQIANYETENHEFHLEVRFEICQLRFQVGKAAVGMACSERDESDKSWLSTFKQQIDSETFT